MTLSRAISGVLLAAVLAAQAVALKWADPMSVPAGSLVELSTDKPAIWVPQRPLTLDLRSYEVVTSGDGRAFLAVFYVSEPAGSQLVIDAYSNGEKVPDFTRHVLTVIEGPPGPGPLPPGPDPDDPDPPGPLPDSKYGVGPAVSRAFATFPTQHRPTVIGAFQRAQLAAMTQSATLPVIIRQIQAEMQTLQNATGGAAAAPYEIYKRAFRAAAAAGKLRTIGDYAGAYGEVVEWLQKGGTEWR